MNSYLKCSNGLVFYVTADLHNPKEFTTAWFSTAKLQSNINFINFADVKHFMNVLKKMHFSITLWKVLNLSVCGQVTKLGISFSVFFVCLFLMSYAFQKQYIQSDLL